jgi:hypothetical protein
MMLPWNTKTGWPVPPSVSQNPFAGQCVPVLAAKVLELAPDGLRYALRIFFTMDSKSHIAIR